MVIALGFTVTDRRVGRKQGWAELRQQSWEQIFLMGNFMPWKVTS